MARQPAEVIQGKKVKDLILDRIQSRRLGKLGIPHTAYEWITLLLKIETTPKGELLLIDGVADFEDALARSAQGDIFFEFLETEGVPCQFRTSVVRCSRGEIWAELPKEILRNQRRAYFRIQAAEGAEVHFMTPRGKEIKTALKDYSLGGLSFYAEENLPLAIGDVLEKFSLSLPQGKERVSIDITKAMAIRWDRGSWEGRPLWAFEFREIADIMKEKLRRNIFINQRDLLRRVRRVSTAKGPGT